MKKIFLLTFTIITFTIFSSIAYSSDITGDLPNEEIKIENAASEQIPSSMQNNGMVNEEPKDSKEISPAGDEIISAVSKKDRRIAELTDKYNNKANAVVAYYLEVVRYYSTPIFFIFLTIGAFNFFIVGNKKLDKKEQGFGWITACIIGWVFFQCIPLIFALFAL